MIKQLDAQQYFAISGGSSVLFSASTIGTAIGACVGGLFSLTKCVQPANTVTLEYVTSTYPKDSETRPTLTTRYHCSRHNMLGVFCAVAGMLTSGLIKVAFKR